MIELKSEDTDVESFRQKANQRRSTRSTTASKRRRRANRRVDPKTYNGESENHDDAGEKTDGETADDGKASRKRPQRKWFWPRIREVKRPNNKEGTADSGTEKSEGEEGKKKSAKDSNGKKSVRSREKAEKAEKEMKERKENRQRSVCIRVSNINRTMRIKELKQELRSRDCNPYFIKWNGFHGRCYLHFSRKPDQSDDVTAAALMKRLEDLTLTLPSSDSKEGEENNEPKVVKLKCEIFKRKEGVNGEEAQAEPESEPAKPESEPIKPEPTKPATNGTVLEGSRIETTDVTAV